jgi:hypothetical protein
LLESSTRPGSHAGLKLLSLGLQYRGSKECHLLALLYAAQNLGVVEIADSNPNHPWRVLAILTLHEHEHRAAGPAGSSRSSTRRTAAAATTAPAATAAPASR